MDNQHIQFQTEDGTALVGYYYPAALNPAPLVVLMHWAGGDRKDWMYVGMAAWLQNRGAEILAAPGQMYFDTPCPFPPLPEGLSFSVFSFDFRGHGESGPDTGNVGDLVMDARAAYTAAAALPGVDPNRVAGIGASIGADGAVEGSNAACNAALSLSPGCWLGFSYSAALTTLDDQAKTVWCVSAMDDDTALETCKAPSSKRYRAHLYVSGGRAMQLFKLANSLQPPIETVILDYLRQVFPYN